MFSVYQFTLLLIPLASCKSGEYDFIIIGAGTAGCTLANRLSENPNWKILLLEAGGESVPRVLVDMPLFSTVLPFTSLNWGYKMEKQNNIGLGLNENRILAPRGKGIGGSSLINFMMDVRGNDIDYDKWAELGNAGWSFKDAFPYLKKLETSLIYDDDYAYRGHDGPVYSSYVPFQTNGVGHFLKAAQEKGYPYLDYNGQSQFGVSLIQSSTKTGKRWSAEEAYIRPVRNSRNNLIISTNSRVLKILIDPKTKKAYGVEYNKNFQRRIATVTKEIILSAGAFNSPQILMLSGVGPEKHLQTFNISVVKDSPVGQVLYDHLSFTGLIFKTGDIKDVISFGEFLNPQILYDYFVKNEGVLSSIAGIEAVGYFNTNVTNERRRPDVEIIYVGGGLQSDAGLIFKQLFNIDTETFRSIWGKHLDEPLFQIMPVLLHPKSKGKILLKSRNPFDAPRIYGHYFTDPDGTDKKVLLKGIREIQRIINSSEYKKHNASIVDYKISGCAEHKFDSDEFWYCALEHLTISLYHPSTTCKMGPEEDEEAVVDSKLKVHGIERLRVIDASIMPSTVSGHLNIPTFMIGEKGADLIKKEWNNNKFRF